jgi:hypothetical protein
MADTGDEPAPLESNRRRQLHSPIDLSNTSGGRFANNVSKDKGHEDGLKDARKSLLDG